MSLGFLSVVAVAVRLAMIVHLDSRDFTQAFTMWTVWGMIEAHVGLWAASFPALHPFFRTLLRRLGFGSAEYKESKATQSTKHKASASGEDSRPTLRRTHTGSLLDTPIQVVTDGEIHAALEQDTLELNHVAALSDARFGQTKEVSLTVQECSQQPFGSY